MWIGELLARKPLLIKRPKLLIFLVMFITHSAHELSFSRFLPLTAQQVAKVSSCLINVRASKFGAHTPNTGSGQRAMFVLFRADDFALQRMKIPTYQKTVNFHSSCSIIVLPECPHETGSRKTGAPRGIKHASKQTSETAASNGKLFFKSNCQQ